MAFGINIANNPLHFYKPYDIMLDFKSLEILDSTDIDGVTDNVNKVIYNIIIII